MANELVTVVTPAYNAADFVERTIRSIHRQSWRPLESVVVDDASSDNTAAVVEQLSAELGSRDFRVRLIRHEVNRRAAGALRTGFSAAGGDWVSWLSADDEFVDVDKTTGQVVAMRAGGADISYFRGMFTGPSTESAKRLDRMFFSRLGPLNRRIERSSNTRLLALMFSNPINGSSAMMRRSTMLEFDDALGVPDEDSDMWLRSSAAGLKFAALKGAPVFYRDHPDQVSKGREQMVFGGSVTRLRMVRYLRDTGRLGPLLESNALLLNALATSASITRWPAVTQEMCDFALDSGNVSSLLVRTAARRILSRLDALGTRGRAVSPELEAALSAAVHSEVFTAFIERMEPAR